jgi:rhodanese-related sulfurtransferase
VTISRTGAAKKPLEVSLTIGGTATDVDYAEAPIGATVVIPTGAKSVDIEITPIDDVEVEGVETIEVTLAPADKAYRVGSASAATVLIADDDAVLVDLSVEDAFDLVTSLAGDPDFVILDVRTLQEFASGHLENATNIDFYAGDFLERLDALDRRAIYLVYCRSGGRSGSAHDDMAALGFATVYNMVGGITAWSDAGYPVVGD